MLNKYPHVHPSPAQMARTSALREKILDLVAADVSDGGGDIALSALSHATAITAAMLLPVNCDVVDRVQAVESVVDLVRKIGASPLLPTGVRPVFTEDGRLRAAGGADG